MSSETQDNGVIELNFNNEQFLPFEGARATSTWKLELSTVVRQFGYQSISDFILHVRYTSIDGGPLLNYAANQAVSMFRSSM